MKTPSSGKRNELSQAAADAGIAWTTQSLSASTNFPVSTLKIHNASVLLSSPRLPNPSDFPSDPHQPGARTTYCDKIEPG